MKDFNDAGEQRTNSPIPAGEICVFYSKLKPGGAGEGGWYRRSKDGNSLHLDCEFTVLGGEYDGRKVWTLLTMEGTTTGHAEAAEISLRTLRAVLESARGVRPDDTSDTAKQARQIKDWGDFNGLRFMARVGVRPAEGSYPAKNTLTEIITPDRRDWHNPNDPQQPPPAGPKGSTAPTPPANGPAPAATPEKPAWAR
jgi:hypothetical protein